MGRAARGILPPFFRLRAYIRKPRVRSQVNVQSTGRWAGPISADGMLPESAETLRQLCGLGKGKKAQLEAEETKLLERMNEDFDAVAELGRLNRKTKWTALGLLR